MELISKATFLFVGLLVWPAFAGAQLPHGIPDLCAGSPDRIPAGQTITFSGVVIKGCLAVEGTLILSDNVDLTVTTILQHPGSAVLWGTERQPSRGRLRFANVAPSDPEQYGTGWIGFGRVELYGVPKTSFVRLASEAFAGQTTLTLESAPEGWHSGDRLILPGTNQHFPDTLPYEKQWETLNVVSVSGATVTLAAPLRFDHRGARDLDGNLRFLPHVGNLTRSITIDSVDPSATRGHILFTDRASVDIRHVMFQRLGRTTIAPLNNTVLHPDGSVARLGTNQIGRYPLHLHHLKGPLTPQANSYQFTLIGNVVEGSPKWGPTIHGTHYGIVQDSVVFDTAGAGIVTEDGSETGNIFDRNFVVVSWGTGNDRADGRAGSADWGWEGCSYWFRGPANTITRNVGANANAYGMCFMMIGTGGAAVPVAQGSVETRATNMAAQPWREFRDNELYSVHNGFTIWDYHASCCTAVFEGPDVPIKNLRLWHTGRRGYYGYASNRLTLDGFTHINRTDFLHNPSESPVSLYFGDYLARNTSIRNADIQGLRVGIAIPDKVGDTSDIYGIQPGTLLIENSVLRNVVNVHASTQYGVTGGGTALPPRRTTIRNVAFGTLPTNVGGSSQYQIAFTFNPVRPNANVLVRDEIFVEQPAGSYRVYMKEQASDFVLPAEAGSLAGLTNQQAWQQEQKAIAGAVTPCTTVVPEVLGFVCGGFAASPPIPVGPLVPPPPGEAPNAEGPGRCTVSEWSEWSAWSEWTVAGHAKMRTRTRTRTVINPGGEGHSACPRLTDTETQVVPAQAPEGSHH